MRGKNLGEINRLLSPFFSSCPFFYHEESRSLAELRTTMASLDDSRGCRDLHRLHGRLIITFPTNGEQFISPCSRSIERKKKKRKREAGFEWKMAAIKQRRDKKIRFSVNWTRSIIRSRARVTAIFSSFTDNVSFLSFFIGLNKRRPRGYFAKSHAFDVFDSDSEGERFGCNELRCSSRFVFEAIGMVSCSRYEYLFYFSPPLKEKRSFRSIVRLSFEIKIKSV